MSLVGVAKDEIWALVDEAMLNFNNIADDDWNAKPNPSKWSKKELLGHLIDSAANNLRRFLVAQYETGTKIVYDQDKWVAYQNYQQMDVEHIKTLFKLLNYQISNVIANIPQSKLDCTCDTGIGKAEVHSLVYFIEDYILHLKYHLKQIIDSNYNAQQ